MNHDYTFEFEWTTCELVDAPLQCTCEYRAGEAQTWEEPGYPPSVSVIAVRAGGIDIIGLLPVEQLRRVEQLAIRETV